MRFYSPLLFCFLVFTVIATACNSERKKEAAAQQKAPPRPPANVDGYIVQTKILSESIEIPGTIVADQSTNSACPFL